MLTASEEIVSQPIPLTRFHTTNPYQMAYLLFKGLKIVKVEKKAALGRKEITFEGPNAHNVAALYHNSSEKVLFDSFIIIKSHIYEDGKEI